MRNFNECKAEIFRRIDIGIKERKRKRNCILKCCVPLCLCFVIFSTAVIMELLPAEVMDGLLPANNNTADMGGNKEGAVVTSPHGGEIEPPQLSDGVSDKEFEDTDCALAIWNDKTVTVTLLEILNSADDEEYLKIYLVASLDRQDQDFSYQGKTLKWYADNANKNGLLVDKLAALPKVGNALKYGDALYTTGTPDGEKWSKELYEKTVEYYGSDFLNKYIVNGEFLLDKVLADEQKALSEIELAYRDYENAFSEYKKSKLTEMYVRLKEKGVNAGISDTGNTLMILITKDEFVNLEFDNMQEWTFTVENFTGTDMNDDDDIPIPDDDNVIE